MPALAAGIWHWQKGRFDLFRVNPPLVRCVAALPVIGMRPEVDWSSFQDRVNFRSEFDVGGDLVRANGVRSFWLFTAARWACIPFSVLGALVCYCWGRDLYGARAGFVAQALWCFSPNVLAHAQMITPDAPAAACGALACYLFWRWLKSPTWPQSLAAGAALGVAELVKTTWLVLFPLWPALWLVWTLTQFRRPMIKSRRSQALQLICILLLGIVILDVGYGGEGLCRPLGRFRFVSRMLGGDIDANVRRREGANRFRGTYLEHLPVLLPENYVLGLDIQKSDFEVGLYSYMRGRWRTRGWWYYYLYAFVVKEPVGTILLFSLAAFLSFQRYRADWRNEMVVLGPLLVVFLLVSSQTGMNYHPRYVLPAFPFLFVYASKTAKPAAGKRRLASWVAIVALAGTVTSSMWSYPHNLSYFNEFGGGPEKGSEHLLNSNIDWGQDILYLKKWYSDHALARPLHLAHAAYFDPAVAGITFVVPPVDPRWMYLADETCVGPYPGWHALSVNRIRSRTKEYAYFLHFKPIASAGYSIYIYHITLDEANRV
ncbi:MAG: glycosyltransferase family 39 protein, partial [Planctomycetes bacterium]|nr:glycosyltransferase family 39 protein [Planctomycetota bacterium]